MAKKKSTPTATSKPKITFHAYMREQTVAPVITHDVTQIPYVFHGQDNLFPEEIRSLVDNTGPLERCITQLSEFIAGMGPKFYNEAGDEIPEAMVKWQEWMSETSEEEFMAKTAYDLAHGFGMTWAVRRAAGGAAVRLDHRSRFGFRAAKMVDGKIPAMYWSNDWNEAEWNSTNPLFKPVKIPAFDWSGTAKEAEAIIFEKQYHPKEPVYGKLFWLGCKRAAEVWVKVDNYNRTQIDTGFTPTVILGTRKEGTEAELDRHDERVEMAYTGSTGRGLMHIQLGVGEEEPFVQVLDRTNQAGELDEMRNGSAEVIYETFGIPSLLLRDREEGMTSQERAITIRLQQMQRTLVSAMQKMPGRAITRLMNMEGVKVWETKFVPLEIFDPVQSEVIIQATQLVDEAREMRGDEAHWNPEIGKMTIAQASKLAPDPEEATKLAKMKLEQPVIAPGAKPVDPEKKPVTPPKE